MALQLKNKVDKEKKDNATKGGKYKRKRNVFGKRLFRFGLVGTIAVLTLAFVGVKVFFTLQQNKKQKQINQELADVKNQIEIYKRQINRPADAYENVGELIATLPTTFDRQATSLDLDRITILSGLTESDVANRRMSEAEALPFECSVKTVKAIKIEMYLCGSNENIKSLTDFIGYITNYSHENFYYIESISYSEDRIVNKRTNIYVELYTFYNDITLNPTTQTTTTTQA